MARGGEAERLRHAAEQSERSPLRAEQGIERPWQAETSPGHTARSVAQFHEAFQLLRNNAPTADVPDEVAELRARLLAEELDEYAAATASRDLVGIADALADLVYLAYGAAVTYGIDLDAVLAEVHRSNMSKLGAGGHPIVRADGKVLKSDRYLPPDVANVLRRQNPLPW